MFELVEQFGVRVVTVDCLDQDVIYVHGHGIALGKAGLDAEGQRWAASWPLSEALGERLPL